MKTIILLTALTVATLAGCSKSDQSETTNPTFGRDHISAVAKALDIEADVLTQTKAVIADAKNLQAVVLTSQVTNTYATPYAKGTMKFDATDAANTAVGYEATGFTGNTKLPADKSSLFMTALYPGTLASWTNIGTTADYTFNGTQDVMAAPQMEIKKGGTETAAFAFAHLLTKVDITVKATDADAVAAWGDVKKIEITKVVNGTTFNDKIAVTLTDATAATTTAFSQAAAGQPATWKTYTTADAEFTGQTVALTTTAASIATTIMAPFTATATATDLEVAVTTKTTTGSELITKVAITVPAGDTQGKQYAINLNFKAKDIKGTATVAAWGTAIDIPKDVE